MQQAVATQSRELVNQQRLSILPNLIVGFTKQQNPIPPHEIFECLELRNIGNGPAVNIEVNHIRVNYADNAFARIRFENFLYLEPNKETSPTQKFAHLRILIDNEAIEPTDPADFATWLVPSEFQTSPVSFLGEYNNDPKINLLLRFENVNGLRYEQSAVMQVDKSSLRPSRLGVPKIEDSLSNNSE